jgi:hypothetical protein
MAIVDPRTKRTRLQATGDFSPVKMTEIGEFEATRRLGPPAAYLLKPDQSGAVDLLLSHGIQVESMRAQATLDVEQYDVTGLTQSSRPFQGHRETKLTVSRSPARIKFPAGSFVITTRQAKAPLVFYLLEPESDDGLANWNFFDSALMSPPESPRIYPVYRATRRPPRGQAVKLKSK